MDHVVPMRVTQTGTDLLDVLERLLERQVANSCGLLKISAFEIFKYKVMKNRPDQIAGRPMSEPADDVRVTNRSSAIASF
jgi:hypothetical protein